MSTPEAILTEPAFRPDDQVGHEQVAAMRTMFGTPRIAVEPVLCGSSADEVVTNPKIAVIDDEPINVKVVEKHLRLAGYRRFATTSDSREALELVRGELPDVVLLDVMMPHVSGLEILDALRADAATLDLPVIILTAATDRETKLRALLLGATEFLGKPVDAVELEARLANVLTVKAHQDRVKRYAWELEVEVAIRTTELAEAHREVIECLAKVGEYRDSETGNHVLRVGCYAEIIARRLGMDDESAGRLRHAATLHDIGKVGIPDAILLKPGKLDEAEFTEMQRHCCFGKRICTRQPKTHEICFPTECIAEEAEANRVRSPILKLAASVAATHHERWDGTGYPRGISGEQIPIEGRITAVADVFDAVTSRRPYKEALPVEEALAILREGRGTQFDPAVVDAFFAGLDDILDVRKYYADL